MRKFKLHRPSPAMVVAIVACFFAIGGAAVIAKKKNKKVKIAAKNSVATKSIRNRAVTTPKLILGEQTAGFRTNQAGAIALPAATDTTVATLSLPAGATYFVSAKASLGATVAAYVIQCTLKSNGTTIDQSDANAGGAATNYTHTVADIGFSSGGTVTLSCNPATASNARNRVIDAVRVDGVTG